METAQSQLHELIEAVRADSPAVPAVQPPPEPAPGQPIAAWLAEVADARAAADARALEHRTRVDALSRSLFGTTAAELVATPGDELHRATVVLDVPNDDALDGIPLRSRSTALDAPSATSHPLRIVVTAPQAPTSAIIRLHGGAFWMGGGTTGDVIDKLLIDALATRLNAAVLNVDYRLAPEHPFPASICDTLQVLDAVRSGAIFETTPWQTIDPRKVAIVGTSSGANVATAAARADALRNGTPPLAALGLLVPSVLISDAPDDLRSDEAAWAVRQRQLRGYLGEQLRVESPWVSLANGPIPAGMPATFAAIAAHDEIAIGGQQLCGAINEAGSPARAVEYTMTHTIAPPEVEAAMIEDLISFLSEHLTKAHATPTI